MKNKTHVFMKHKTYVFMKHNITFIVFFNVGAVCLLCFHFHPSTVFFILL